MVPIDGPTATWRSSRRAAQESQFVDPANAAAGPITWQGSWRTLDRAWTFSPQWSNYVDVWDLIDYPRLLFNTIAIALIGMIGTVVSCTLVAYGFARFRFPGRGLLFTLLIATIFLPSAVTLIPTYTMFAEAGLGRDLAAAAGPDVLRQRLRRVPAAPVPPDDPARDGRGGGDRRRRPVPDPDLGDPARRRGRSIVAVAIFHFVYSWNDFFAPLIYLSTKPELQPLAVGPAAVQRHPLPQPGVRPGRHPDDDGHPGHPVPHLPAGVHPRHRGHGSREVADEGRAADARSGSRSRSTPSTPTGRPAGHDRGCSTCWRGRGRGRRCSSRVAGRRRTRRSPGRIAEAGHLVGNHSTTTRGCRS